jgi:hypothetical protein
MTCDGNDRTPPAERNSGYCVRVTSGQLVGVAEHVVRFHCNVRETRHVEKLGTRSLARAESRSPVSSKRTRLTRAMGHVTQV